MTDNKSVSARVTEAFLDELGRSLDHAELVDPIRAILALEKTLKPEKLLSIYASRLVEVDSTEGPE